MRGPDLGAQPGEVPQALLFGQRFTVARRAGGEVEATSLSRIPGGLYARLDEGEIVRVHAGEVDWETCRPRTEQGSGLVAGDHLLIESPAGTLRGELVRPPDGASELVLRLSHGAELPIPLAPIRRAFILLVKPELEPGDLFEVKSKSGNVYAGIVQQRLSPARVLVELESGKSVDIRLERLRLETLVVRLPIPVAHLLGQRAQLEAEPRPKSQRLRPALAPAKAEPARGPRETERLQRELLRQALELEQLKAEREALAQQREELAQEKKEKERELESEVWRGYAVNRDLAEAKKRLEELEEALDQRQAAKPQERSE